MPYRYVFTQAYSIPVYQYTTRSLFTGKIYVLLTPKSVKSHEMFRKFEPKWVITLFGKKVIPSKVKAWVNIFYV